MRLRPVGFKRFGMGLGGASVSLGRGGWWLGAGFGAEGAWVRARALGLTRDDRP